MIDALEERVAALRHHCERAEVYAKRGRSRRLEVGIGVRDAVLVEEAGWAVRAGDDRLSFFVAATGSPRPVDDWPQPRAPGLRLPAARLSIPTSVGSAGDPLIGSAPGLELLDEVGRALERELPGARLVEGRLEDGASEAWLASSEGMRCRARYRLAVLRLRALSPESAGEADLVLTVRRVRDLQPAPLARRLADLLVVRGAAPTQEESAAVASLLAPEVGARLLAGLVPALVGRTAWRHLRELQRGDGRVAAEALSLVDDGRLPDGPFSAPVDGEGVATAAILLIDRGQVVQPLLPWTEGAGGGRISGCRPRFSWREPPRTGPSHLFVVPDLDCPPARLLAELERGYYWIDGGEARIDFDRGELEITVAGFRIESGRATCPLSGVRLRGAITTFLGGVRAVARDLRFLPLDGAVGVPTMRVDGLQLVSDDDPSLAARPPRRPVEGDGTTR